MPHLFVDMVFFETRLVRRLSDGKREHATAKEQIVEAKVATISGTIDVPKIDLTVGFKDRGGFVPLRPLTLEASMTMHLRLHKVDGNWKYPDANGSLAPALRTESDFGAQPST